MEHIKLNVSNVAVIFVIAILAIGITIWMLRWFATMGIPGASHLAVGGLTFLK